MPKIQRALLSVFDKTGLIPFAQALATAGVEIISTGGTAKVLREQNQYEMLKAFGLWPFGDKGLGQPASSDASQD